jgi:hypothetical protein
MFPYKSIHTDGICAGVMVHAPGTDIYVFQIYCAKRTFPKLHITATGEDGGACPRQAQIKPDSNYKSHISPLSPPLSGGSLRGQVIPTCFARAPQ